MIVFFPILNPCMIFAPVPTLTNSSMLTWPEILTPGKIVEKSPIIASCPTVES